MKRSFAALLAALAVSACTSIETATVAKEEVSVQGGEAMAVIQADAIGISAIFYLVDIVRSDLDTVVNKLLVSEAKALGASKVVVNKASTAPRHGIFALAGGIISFPLSHAEGVAVR